MSDCQSVVIVIQICISDSCVCRAFGASSIVSFIWIVTLIKHQPRCIIIFYTHSSYVQLGRQYFDHHSTAHNLSMFAPTRRHTSTGPLVLSSLFCVHFTNFHFYVHFRLQTLLSKFDDIASTGEVAPSNGSSTNGKIGKWCYLLSFALASTFALSSCFLLARSILNWMLHCRVYLNCLLFGEWKVIRV